MAAWFEITFTGGEPAEEDFARVAELAAEGCTNGQLLNDPPALSIPEHPANTAWQNNITCALRECPGFGTAHGPLS
jgi:hypothetical protein